MLKPTVALDSPLAEDVDETTNNVSDHPVCVVASRFFLMVRIV